jgi:hypothetical protein
LVYTARARISIEVDAYSFTATVTCLLTNFRPSAMWDRPPIATITQLPLYLLHAALRL